MTHKETDRMSTTLTITDGDVDKNGVYKHPNLTHDGPIVIEPDYIHVTGSIKAGGSIKTGGSIKAGGSIEAGGFVEAGEFIKTGGFVEAGGFIKTGEFVEAGGFIKTGEFVEAGRFIEAGGFVEAGEFIKVGWSIEAGWSIKTDGVIAGWFIEAGGFIEAGENYGVWAGVGTRLHDVAGRTVTCTELRGPLRFGELNLIAPEADPERRSIVVDGVRCIEATDQTEEAPDDA